MNVILTDEAIADLVRIGQFIQKDNPLRAITFVAELEERCRRLALTPLAYPLLPGREAAGIRRRAYGNYLIFYRVGVEELEILHVVNGARDYESLLFPEH